MTSAERKAGSPIRPPAYDSQLQGSRQAARQRHHWPVASPRPRRIHTRPARSARAELIYADSGVRRGAGPARPGCTAGLCLALTRGQSDRALFVPRGGVPSSILRLKNSARLTGRQVWTMLHTQSMKRTRKVMTFVVTNLISPVR